MNTNSGTGEENMHSEVMSAFNELVAAAESLDLDRYFSLFNKQRFTSLNDNGSVTDNFNEFEASFRSQIQAVEKYNSLEFQNVRVSELTDDVCVLVNEYSAELLLKSGAVVQAAGAGTQVWCKSSGSWLLAHVSSSTSPLS